MYSSLENSVNLTAATVLGQADVRSSLVLPLIFNFLHPNCRVLTTYQRPYNGKPSLLFVVFGDHSVLDLFCSTTNDSGEWGDDVLAEAQSLSSFGLQQSTGEVICNRQWLNSKQ